MGDDHGFWRDGGSLALDFVGTTGRARGELLREPADLVRWLEETDLVVGVAGSAAQLGAARELRAAMARLVGGVVRGAAADPAAVEAVNAAAAVPAEPPRLTSDATGRLALAPPSATVEAGLAAVARDLVTLLGGPLAARLRECEADDCSGVFVDVSRGGRRRWCSSAGCGNRARVRAHRAARARP